MNSATPTHAVDAIVIKHVAYGDADLIVTMVTPLFGKVTGIARSAKKSQKRFAGGFDPGNQLRVILHEKNGRDLVTIMESRLVHRPEVTSLSQVAALGIGLEIIDQLMPIRQADEIKFAAAAEFVRQINAFLPPPSVLVGFGLRLLSLAGFEPVLDRCVGCQGKVLDDALFDAVASGIKCRQCAGKMEGILLSIRDRESLQQAMNNPESMLENVYAVPKGGAVVRQYLSTLLHRPLQADAYWDMLGEWR